MKQISTFIAFFLLCVLSARSHAESRMWTDSEGRSMQAAFVKTVSLPAGKLVVFQKANGKGYQFPLAQLCEADRHYILTLEAGASTAAHSAAQMTDFEKRITKDLLRFDDSYVGDHYVGPTKVMRDLEKKLKLKGSG